MLAEVEGHVVAVRSGNQFGMSFHPELDADNRIHELFLKTVQAWKTQLIIRKNKENPNTRRKGVGSGFFIKGLTFILQRVQPYRALSGTSIRERHRRTSWPTQSALIRVPSPHTVELVERDKGNHHSQDGQGTVEGDLDIAKTDAGLLESSRTRASAGSMITSAITSKLMPSAMIMHPMTR